MRAYGETISFIIPAHNAEKTLGRAVESIALRCPGAEILIVENGSCDGTLALAQQLGRQHGGVRVLHSGQGVSAARNCALDAATREWIAFVDADDLWLAGERELEALLEPLRGVDFIACSYQKDSASVIHDFAPLDTSLTGAALTAANAWMLSRPTLRMTVWAKLFRLAFLRDNGLRFDEALRLSEDSAFLCRCMARWTSCAVSAVPVYRHCSDAPSVTRCVDSGKTQGYLDALRLLDDELRKMGTTPLMQKAVRDYRIAQMNLMAVHDIFNCAAPAPWRRRKERMRQVLGSALLSGAMQSVTMADAAVPMLLPAWLFKHDLLSAGGLLCYLRSVQNLRRYRAAAAQAGKEYKNR